MLAVVSVRRLLSTSGSRLLMSFRAFSISLTLLSHLYACLLTLLGLSSFSLLLLLFRSRPSIGDTASDPSCRRFPSCATRHPADGGRRRASSAPSARRIPHHRALPLRLVRAAGRFQINRVRVRTPGRKPRVFRPHKHASGRAPRPSVHGSAASSRESLLARGCAGPRSSAALGLVRVLNFGHLAMPGPRT